MELTWLMRLRIAAAMVLGVVLLGVVGWHFVEPESPHGAVTLYGGDITISDGVLCLGLAVAAGVAGYFAAWPFGREIGPLAAPAGVAYWAIRSGDMSSLLGLNTALSAGETVVKRQAMYGMLRWECVFWLALVAAGYMGVLLAGRVIAAKRKPSEHELNTKNSGSAVSIAAAVLATVVITQFAMGVLAQDVRFFDSELGSVVGQPGKAQIAFALIVSFGLAAFVCKSFLDVGYVVPVIATCGAVVYGMWAAARPAMLEHMVENWAWAFYWRSTAAVLPIETVSFGAIGAVGGYWIAISYGYWRKHAE
jgi:hypothetical protein